MKKFIKFVMVSCLFISGALVNYACSQEQTSEKQHPKINVAVAKDVESYIEKAKIITSKYKLTSIKPACLVFEKLPDAYEGKIMVDVRGIQGAKCGGDPNVSPRLFSIGFDKEDKSVWTDAKSSVGQLEKIANE